MALTFMVQEGEYRDFPDGPVVKMGVKMQGAVWGGGCYQTNHVRGLVFLLQHASVIIMFPAHSMVPAIQ